MTTVTAIGPPPELRGRRVKRHTAITISTARRMHADGWTPTELARYFASQGNPVPMTTIRSWVLPPTRSEAYREQMAAHARNMRAAKRAAAAGTPIDDIDAALRRALALRRDHGLTYPTLSVILAEYHGVQVGEDTLRRQLGKMGAERNPNKARATREQMAARRR